MEGMGPARGSCSGGGKLLIPSLYPHIFTYKLNPMPPKSPDWTVKVIVTVFLVTSLSRPLYFLSPPLPHSLCKLSSPGPKAQLRLSGFQETGHVYHPGVQCEPN